MQAGGQPRSEKNRWAHQNNPERLSLLHCCAIFCFFMRHGFVLNTFDVHLHGIYKTYFCLWQVHIHTKCATMRDKSQKNHYRHQGQKTRREKKRERERGCLVGDHHHLRAGLVIGLPCRPSSTVMRAIEWMDHCCYLLPLWFRTRPAWQASRMLAHTEQQRI